MSTTLAGNLNDNFSKLENVAVSAGSLNNGVNDILLANLIQTAEHDTTVTANLALTCANLQQAAMNKLVLSDNAALLTADAAMIVDCFNLTAVGDVVAITLVRNAATTAGTGIISLNATSVMVAALNVSIVLLTATNVTSGAEAVSVTLASSTA